MMGAEQYQEQEKSAQRISELGIFIDNLKKTHAREIDEKNNAIKELHEEIKTLHYALQGACVEHLHLNIQMDASMLTQDTYETISKLYSYGAKDLATHVERQLGGRHELLKAYDEARRYIYYLQNHAARHGVSFSEFSEKIFK